MPDAKTDPRRAGEEKAYRMAQAFLKGMRVEREGHSVLVRSAGLGTLADFFSEVAAMGFRVLMRQPSTPRPADRTAQCEGMASPAPSKGSGSLPRRKAYLNGQETGACTTGYCYAASRSDEPMRFAACRITPRSPVGIGREAAL